MTYHIDKSVTVGSVVTFFTAIITAIWFFSAQATQVDALKEDVAELSVSVQNLKQNANTQAIQLGRIEENLKQVSTNIRDIKDYLEDTR